MTIRQYAYELLVSFLTQAIDEAMKVKMEEIEDRINRIKKVKHENDDIYVSYFEVLGSLQEGKEERK